MTSMTPVVKEPHRAGPHGGRRHWPRVLGIVGAILALAAIAVTVTVANLPSGGPSQTSAQHDHGGRSLIPAHGALFGAYVQPTGGFQARKVESDVVRFERALGRKLAIDQFYVHWAAPMPLALARWDLREGRIPLISWAPTRTDLIAAGAYDAQIRARALQLRDLRGPVMLRWFAEMDGLQYQANAVSPASFIRAWRHIHDIFSSVGTANVHWVWCPTSYHFETGLAQQFYPGNAYVDWIGADGYSWAPKHPRASWRSFAQIFSVFYRWSVRMGKPLLVGEYGVLERAPGEKAAWFRQADRQLRTQFPAIRAVVYFNSNHEHYNWKVTTSRSALAAFRAFARDPYFSARPAM